MKFIKTVRCVSAEGARSRSNPQNGLVAGQTYGVLADVRDAQTPTLDNASGYFLYNTVTGKVMHLLYRRNRFEDVVEAQAPAASVQAPVTMAEPLPIGHAVGNSSLHDFDVGDQVIYSGPYGGDLQVGRDYLVAMVVEDATTPYGGQVRGLIVSDNDDNMMPGVYDAGYFQMA